MLTKQRMDFWTDHNSNPSNEGSWGHYYITDKCSRWHQPRLQCWRLDDYSGSHRSSRLNWRVCSPRSQWWEVAIHWFWFVGTITFRAQIIIILQLTWYPSVLSIIYYKIHEFLWFFSHHDNLSHPISVEYNDNSNHSTISVGTDLLGPRFAGAL